MKVCTICKVKKSLSEFSPRTFVKDGYYSRCKDCHREEVRKAYRKNPQIKLEDCKNRRKVLSDMTDEIKRLRGCKICKENDPVCLDFHHTNPYEKDLSVSRLVGLKSKKRVLAEIEKCIVVCANCHRKIHFGKILTTDVMAA